MPFLCVLCKQNSRLGATLQFCLTRKLGGIRNPLLQENSGSAFPLMASPVFAA